MSFCVSGHGRGLSVWFAGTVEAETHLTIVYYAHSAAIGARASDIIRAPHVGSQRRKWRPTRASESRVQAPHAYRCRPAPAFSMISAIATSNAASGVTAISGMTPTPWKSRSVCSW